MKNRHIGFLIIGIAILMGTITYLFNRALTTIVNDSCSHGPTCPMWGTIDVQTKIGIAIMIFVITLGLYFILFAEEKIPGLIQAEPKMSKDNFKKIIDGLDASEKEVFEKILDSKGTIFQSELVDKTGMSKVKVTRILDKLQGRGIIERKRRGMTNVVILTHGG